ncbi:MAG: cupin domain-containing protein [Weeksellaceae bacterium]|jgi:quercetin dioxygenase-like cupin family protein
MPIQETIKNNNYKVLDVTLKAGETMPLHKATSDALVINTGGKARLLIEGKTVILTPGDKYFIGGNIPHKLEILEDFHASVVMEPEAEIKFVES